MFGSSPKASNTLRAFLLGSVAIGLASPLYAAEARAAGAEAVTLEQLEKQMQLLMREIQEMKAKQAGQQQEIQSQSQQIEDQKEKIEVQQKQIEVQQEQIEARQNQPAPVPANVVTGGDKPGSFKLPGTDTSVKIGGYVKGDLIYDVNADVGDSFAFSAIPAEGTVADERENQFRAHARQTRINLQSWTPTDMGEIHTYIEGDFFGTGGNEVLSNSTSFRIRHAYGDFGPVRVGQNWSNFMFLDSYPDTVDFFGPVGIPFIRQGQLRVTYREIENLEIAGSLENSELSGNATDNAGNLLTLGGGRRGDDLNFGIDTLPDFVGRVSYRGDLLSLSASGVARLLDVDDGDDPAAAIPADDEELGWGVLAAGVLNVGKFVTFLGDDSVQANFTYGDGVGRYIINGFNEDAHLDANGNFDTIKSWGVAAAYTHYWSDSLRSNFVYGHYEVDDTFAPDATESLDSIHANLMWTPFPQVQFGLEWIYGVRDFQDSDLDNSAQRVQFAGQFFF